MSTLKETEARKMAARTISMDDLGLDPANEVGA